MATSGKMEYTQADNVLTNAFVTYTFSKDGTNETKPRRVTVNNDDAAGGANTVIVAVNGLLQTRTIEANEEHTFEDPRGRPIKQFKAKFGTAAPDYRFSGEV